MSAPTGNEGFVLAEEAALKERLKGIRVSSAKHPDGEEVNVRFRFPEGERDKVSYPMITIDFLNFSFGAERADSGQSTVLPYRIDEDPVVNDDLDDPNVSTVVSAWPVPVDLFYQITSWARDPRQHRQLLGSIMKHDKLPLRSGWLYIPEDGTYRRLDLMGPVQPTGMKDDRGIFVHRNTYMVRINSELVPNDIDSLRARTIVFDETFGDQIHVFGTIAVF